MEPRETTERAEPLTVIVHPALVPKLKAWLNANDLHLAGPFKDDHNPGIEFHFVGIGRESDGA